MRVKTERQLIQESRQISRIPARRSEGGERESGEVEQVTVRDQACLCSAPTLLSCNSDRFP